MIFGQKQPDTGANPQGEEPKSGAAPLKKGVNLVEIARNLAKRRAKKMGKM
jgi:hypothetical protein